MYLGGGEIDLILDGRYGRNQILFFEQLFDRL